MPADETLAARLSSHRLLAGVPPEQIDWLLAHGSLQRVEAGEVFFPKGAPIPNLHIVLSGRVSIWIDRGAGPRKAMEWGAGDITGLLPYSRLAHSPGESVVEDPLELFVVPASAFRELTRDCYELTAVLVHVMLDRARHFTSTDYHDEKMLSLGKLSAGLAHELNNPASAVARSAKSLVARLTEADASARALGALQLSGSEAAALDRVSRACLEVSARSVRSPVEQADREDEMAEWLERRGAHADAAEALAESTLTREGLDELARALDGPRLDAALRWIASDCATRRLASEIETAAARIHALVAAIKGFTYMDQAAVPKPADVTKGLADTLAVLTPKARARSVAVSLHVDPDLPCVDGYGGELNQIWANLIDNAIDAVPGGGRVEVTASRLGHALAVVVADDGPGISDDVRERIFDPFFTTKGVGQGTGLGLDIVRRLVQRHDGTIDVASRPGRTEFRVTLPFSAGPDAPSEPAGKE